jgi:hypothetical protein
MGKKLPRNMMNIAEPRPTPNHKIAKGIQAIGGMGRKTPIMKPDKFCASFDHPIITPRGMATNAAIRNPSKTRVRVLNVSVIRDPFVNRFTKAVHTAEGLGIR